VRGGGARNGGHSGRIAAPYLPEAVRLGCQLLRRPKLAVSEVLPVGVWLESEEDGHVELLQRGWLEAVDPGEDH
jgi:hypothetical protein